MKLIQLNNQLNFTVRKNLGLLSSIVLVFVLLLARVSSHKYSHDTLVAFRVLRSILIDHSTLIYAMGQGWINSFNYHFNFIYILISPLYYLGPSLLIFSWKFVCYGGFLVILWRLIDSDHRYDISNWHKNLFLLLVALHPTFISNLISPEIWDSDLILPFLGLSILSISRNRYYWAVFWFCSTFLVKEDMMLVGILYGILMALFTKKAKFIWLSVFSLGWFWMVTHVVMPSFATSTEELGLLKFSFGNLGNSMGEIIVNSIIHPHLLIANGWWMRKFASLFIILSCVGFLPFWKKSSLIYLLPGLSVLGYTLIAVQPYLDYSKHYMVALFVFVVWSSYESYVLVNEKFRAKIVLVSVVASIAVIVVLQMNIRVWSYYLFPIENFSTLKSVEEEFIPPKSSMLTGGVSSPWICYRSNCFVTGDFQPGEIEKMEYDYILVNLNTVFWEVLNCSDETIAINLKKLNGNNKYQTLYYADDIVLLKKSHADAYIKQPDWSGHLEKYQQINHDCMKSDLMRKIRLF